MYVRSLDEVRGTERDIDWGNGKSYRLLIESDGMGYGVCHTVVRAGTESLLQYQNHLEACYCISGEGEVEDANGNVFRIRPGDMYVLDQHDRHYLRSDQESDLVLISVFNPPLKGTERHNLAESGASSY
ncbi:ectoine synthase [Streptomyces amakusaensis]|uniref:L-ectoine synthase n=1 Tax=Streptomyces amakusaensis TaxID=67271 RepID=A0ABW0AMF0_9ACTN